MVRAMELVTALALLGVVATFGAVSAPALSPTMAADAAFQAENWPETARLYRQLIDGKNGDPNNWFRLGYALAKQDRAADAIAAFQDGEKHGLGKPVVELGQALALARSDRDKALAHLEAAASSGFNDTKRIDGEQLLAPLKNDPRFAKVMDTVKRNETPCLFAKENRQFDFWVGDWRVVRTGTDAPQVGVNRISLIHNGCVVLESWTSGRSPYAGQSFNTYNAALKRWEQYWVDNSAGTIFFHGGLKNGVMDYWTDDLPQPGGGKMRRHLQFFRIDGNTVRQFSQGSTDGGKTWSVEYDFTYHRTAK
jgi:hypothetical protein